MDQRRAQLFHTVTAVVTVAALVFQLVLIVRGGVVLDEQHPDPLASRLWHFVAYFTVQSNAVVAVAAVMLARDPVRDGTTFRCVRLAGLLGITVTGLVHFFLLRPLLHLHGADYLADKLLHMVVPALAVVGWALFGPRPRWSRAAFWWSIAWPLAYLAYVLVAGAVSGWYPYPFLDVDAKGWPHVLVSSLGVTVLFLLLAGLARLVDQRVRPAPRGDAASTVAP